MNLRQVTEEEATEMEDTTGERILLALKKMAEATSSTVMPAMKSAASAAFDSAPNLSWESRLVAVFAAGVAALVAFECYAYFG